jgi:hypothetical protein
MGFPQGIVAAPAPRGGTAGGGGSSSSDGGGASSSVAGIAAGVVIGVVVLVLLILLGVFLYRKRKGASQPVTGPKTNEGAARAERDFHTRNPMRPSVVAAGGAGPGSAAV